MLATLENLSPKVCRGLLLTMPLAERPLSDQYTAVGQKEDHADWDHKNRKMATNSMTNPFVNLPEEVMTHIWDHLGTGKYRYVAGVSKSFRDSYTRYLEKRYSQLVERRQRDNSSKRRKRVRWHFGQNIQRTDPSCAVESVACAELYIADQRGKPQNFYAREKFVPQELESYSYAHETKDQENCPTLDIFHLAAFHGQMEIIHHFLPRIQLDDRNSHWGCLFAAMGSHWDLIKWFVSNKGEWTREVTEWIAWHGNLDLLVWAMDRKYPYDEEEIRRIASERGHLHIAQCVNNNGRRWRLSHACLAARNGHLEMLKWLVSIDCPCDVSTTTEAASKGHLEVLEWLYNNDYHGNMDTFEAAIGSQDLKILQWLHDKACPWDERTCSEAVKYGNLEMLDWLWDNDCPWDEKASNIAASYGRMEVLEWLYDKGCAINEETCQSAAICGRLEILKWLFEKNCPCDEYTVSVAQKNRREDLLEWLSMMSSPWKEAARAALVSLRREKKQKYR